MPAIRVIFAGGGTGGHLFPAIAIADEVRRLRADAEILFVGTKERIESRVVPQHGYAFKTIWISGLYRSFQIKNLLFPIKLVVSMMQARSILHSFKPHVVVGTGGYVCGPVVRVAVMMKVPTLLQEQNSYPGVTTRMLSHTVDEIHLTFDRSRQYLHRPKSVFVSGNPTRDGLGQAQRDDATKFFGFDQHDPKKTLLVLGGSLGAHSLNQAIEKRSLQFIQQGVRLIWQTGTEDYPMAKRAAERVPGSHIYVSAFIDRMDYAYAAADLVICRAGATTIAELARLGKPSILVPYPHAAANHQVENARRLVEAGAAEMIDDSEVSEKMFTVVTQLLDGSRLEEMSVRSRALGKPDAARIIAEHVIALARH